jgi:dTDP-4-amino-4,6-dideoxygalactose transaminase
MSELHAVVALETLGQLEHAMEKRAALVALYRRRLGEIPGIRFQQFLPGVRSTHNYFVMFIDAARFGLTAAALQRALEADGIVTRRYFHPPVHLQTMYREFAPSDPGALRNTMEVSTQVLCLPLFTHLEEASVESVCREILRVHQHAAEVRRALGEPA